jgi:hypothetical protein
MVDALGLLAALVSLAAPSTAQGECHVAVVNVTVTFVNPGSTPLWLQWVKLAPHGRWSHADTA